MTRTWRIGSLVAAVAVALAIFGMPAQTEALTISTVTVTVNSTTYNSATTGWTFPVTLSGGQDLVLTQNTGGSGLAAYSFDTSDLAKVGSPTSTITITADGTSTTFSSATQTGIFTMNNGDPGGTAFNEATNYTLIGSTSGYQLFLGYADNLHTNTCGSGATSVGLSGDPACLPSPFDGSAFHFEGTGGDNNTGTTTHCTSGSCYDAAVLRIVATTPPVPEPASMMLLGTGLVGLAARYRRRAKKQ